MSKALFLDRDGVINRERGEYTFRIEDFDVLPDVPEALKLASAKGYQLFVISNQGGIAKGLYGHKEVEELHRVLVQKLSDFGVSFQEIHYCPHHESVGKCLCRKPDSLMLEKAIARFDVNPEISVLVGDSERDMQAASKVGVKGILIDSNTGILELVKQLA